MDSNEFLSKSRQARSLIVLLEGFYRDIIKLALKIWRNLFERP
jgi:hypothetical protein